MADTEAVVGEVEAFYAAYIDGFNREESDAFLRSFAYPHALLTGGRGMLVTATAADQTRCPQQTMRSLHERGMIINAKESDQQRFYEEVTSSIQGRGWERTGVDRLQIWPLADSAAMLMADITRHKKDGSVLERGRYCYTVRKDDGAWKIMT